MTCSAALGGVMVALPNARATSATFRFTPSADAYVSQAQPNRNFGTATTLRTQASPKLQRSYLRFDIAGLTGSVTKATLRLYAGSRDRSGYTVRSVASTDWAENGISYANVPLLGAAVASSGAVARNTWTSVDVTGVVHGDGAVSLALTASGSSDGVYASRETGATAPQLVVETLTTAGADTTTTSSSASTTSSASATTSATTTSVPATTSAPATTVSQSCSGVRVPAGASLQQTISASGAGATLCLGVGVHRLAEPVTPKAGQRLIGEPGAVLNGSVLVSSFARSGGAWVADGVLPASPTAKGVCMPGYEGCKYSQAVFYDDRPLWRVLRLSELAPGRFFEDYGANRLYLADDPGGHKVEVARSKGAIDSSEPGVTVAGLVVEKFANDAQRGAILGGSDWTITGNQVRLNHGVGIQLAQATDSKVLDNAVHHNGQLGVSGWRTSNCVFAGNELAFNNTAGFLNIDWEAGGGKWTESAGLTVRGNHAHDNRAIGLWFDGDNRDITIEGNQVDDNDSDGIRYEISYRALIRGNTLAGNGFKDSTGWVDGAGILVESSADVEVADNVVDGNANGITLRQDDRGSGLLGRYVVQNAWVHGNQVTMTRGGTGIASSGGDSSVFTSLNNRFDANQYVVVGSDPTNFWWVGGETSWAEWQRYGQDRTGTFQRQ